MPEELKIKNLLLGVKNNSYNVLELEKYNGDKVIEIGLKEKLYDSLLFIFKPIVIDDVVKIYFDAFSWDIFNKIEDFCGTDEKEKVTYFFEDLYNIDYDLINRMKIKNCHARQIGGWGHPVQSVKDVIYYTEPACLSSSIELYNKNIRTTYNDTMGDIENPGDGICEIRVDSKSLDFENAQVVNELITKKFAKKLDDGDISIFVPCSGNDTVAVISDRLNQIVSKFKLQDMKYGFATIEEQCKVLKDAYRVDVDVDNVVDFCNWMAYDEDENLLWECPEYLEKHKRFLKSKGEIKEGIKK